MQVAQIRRQRAQRVLVQVERVQVDEQADARRQAVQLIRVEGDLPEREHGADERRQLGQPILIHGEGAKVAQLAQGSELLNGALKLILIQP